MKYLVKGGRCTPAAAAAGKLLKLKPILKIYGDKLDKYEIFNRTIVKAKQTMIEAMKNDFNTRFKEFYDNGEMELYIAHTNNAHQAEIFKEEVEQATWKQEAIVNLFSHEPDLLFELLSAVEEKMFLEQFDKNK